MTNQQKTYLLQIIRSNGDISPLAASMSYGEISTMLGNLIEDGLVELDEHSHIRLSERGAKALDGLKKSGGKKTNRFIEPQIEYKIEPIHLDDIYLPEIKSIEDLK